MTTSELNKGTRISFLVSLILHIILALLLGFVLLENPQREATEYVSVDMARVTKRAIPRRRVEVREVIPNLREQPEKRGSRAQFSPRQFSAADTYKPTRQLDSANEMETFPELETNVEQLRSRFDMPLSKPAGARLVKPGIGFKRSDSGSPGGGSIGPSGEISIFETALDRIAQNVVDKNKTGKEDVVFLIDASGSMEENIAAVARYINRMIEVFKESKLDYTMVVIRFNRVLKDNIIKVYEQTTDVNQVRTILRSIRCDGDERTLDAVEVGLTQIAFRQPVDKTFILITDEAFTPRTATRQAYKNLGLNDMLQKDYQEILRMCHEKNVKVSVLGIDDEMHKSLARETEGLWFQIPQADDQP